MPVNAVKITRRYALAVGSVAAVFVLTMLLTKFVPTDVSTLYLAAVMFAAWRGGLAAGLIATVLSVAIATFFFLPPIYSFSLKAEGVVELVVFALTAVVINSLNAARAQALRLERSARREAETANSLKDEFLAAVSHELRTPLTTIKTLTRLLLRKNLPETERREHLEDIASECERQIDFVHNLLDLSRIRAGGVQINLTRVDVGEVLRACENVERVNAAEHDHELAVELAPELPFVRADQNALRRAVCAIAENAIKYTPDGGRIFFRARRDGAAHVVIEIADNGPGIDAADLPHLFERFYRGQTTGKNDNPDAQKISGVGLGLNLARGLIDGMNGTISVDSRPGAGSIFTVRLPVWRESAEPAETESNPAVEKANRAASIKQEKII
ncbi:MAG TPA: ATP-binding protein [Pyrinomonadaceae bacterium]|jgi:signal transduction histidine kinase